MGLGSLYCGCSTPQLVSCTIPPPIWWCYDTPGLPAADLPLRQGLHPRLGAPAASPPRERPFLCLRLPLCCRGSATAVQRPQCLDQGSQCPSEQRSVSGPVAEPSSPEEASRPAPQVGTAAHWRMHGIVLPRKGTPDHGPRWAAGARQARAGAGQAVGKVSTRTAGGTIWQFLRRCP